MPCSPRAAVAGETWRLMGSRGAVAGVAADARERYPGSGLPAMDGGTMAHALRDYLNLLALQASRGQAWSSMP